MPTTVLAEAYAKLQSEEPSARRSGLQLLTELVERGDAHAISTTISCLEDSDAETKALTLKVLSRIPPTARRAAIGEVLALFGHSIPEVRSAALQALRKVASAGDETSIDVVSAYLQHENLDVCRIALQALHHLDRRGIRTKVAVIQLIVRSSQKGDNDSILALVKHLEDDDIEVRNSALDALSNFVEKGDEFAISSLQSNLQHQDPSVRCSTIQAFENILEADNSFGIEALLSSASDPDVRVWCAMMSCYRRVMGDSDERLLSLVQHRLAYEDMDARCDAIRSLFTVFEPSDERIISLVASCLEDKNVDIQLAAADAFASAGKGNRCIIDAVVQLLDQSDPSTRCAAVHALSQVAEAGDETIFKILCKRLRDSDDDVASAVMKAFKVLGVRTTSAVGILQAELLGGDVENKLVFSKALRQLAQEDDEYAIAAFVELSRDEDVDVRRFAVQSLAGLARKSDMTVFIATAKCLEDPDASVRRAAMHASIWCAGDSFRSEVGKALAKGIYFEASSSMSQSRGQIQRYIVEQADLETKLALLRAFPLLLPKNDETTILLCSEYLKDGNASVRCAAVEALAHLAKESPELIHWLSAHLGEDEDLGVKVAALHALIEVAPKDDAGILDVVRSCKDGGNIDVRNVVQLALASLSSISSDQTQDRVCEAKSSQRACLLS